MSVSLRLRRMGKKKQPFYRIVAMDSRAARDARYLENLGTYDPLKDPAEIKVNEERALYWLGQGAIPSSTVRSFLRRKGILLKWHLLKLGADDAAISEEIQKWENQQTERQKRREALSEQATREAKKLKAKEAKELAEAEAKEAAEAEAKAKAKAKAKEAVAETKADSVTAAEDEAKVEEKTEETEKAAGKEAPADEETTPKPETAAANDPTETTLAADESQEKVEASEEKTSEGQSPDKVDSGENSEEGPTEDKEKS